MFLFLHAFVLSLILILCASAAPYESIEHDDYYSDNDVDDEFEDNYDIPPRHGYGDSPDLSNHQPVICRCRVLYDFSGTQSTELTVKEG